MLWWSGITGRQQRGKRICFFKKIVPLFIFTRLLVYALSLIFNKSPLCYIAISVTLASPVVPYEYLKMGILSKSVLWLACTFITLFNSIKTLKGNLFLSLLTVSQGHIQSKQCFVEPKWAERHFHLSRPIVHRSNSWQSVGPWQHWWLLSVLL